MMIKNDLSVLGRTAGREVAELPEQVSGLPVLKPPRASADVMKQLMAAVIVVTSKECPAETDILASLLGYSAVEAGESLAYAEVSEIRSRTFKAFANAQIPCSLIPIHNWDEAVMGLYEFILGHPSELLIINVCPQSLSDIIGGLSNMLNQILIHRKHYFCFVEHPATLPGEFAKTYKLSFGVGHFIAFRAEQKALGRSIKSGIQTSQSDVLTIPVLPEFCVQKLDSGKTLNQIFSEGTLGEKGLLFERLATFTSQLQRFHK